MRFFLVLAVGMWGASAWADVVHLRGGGELRGTATRSGQEVVIRIDGGEIRLPRSLVLRIDRQPHGLETLAELREGFEAEPVAARVAAAQWAEAEGLKAEARALWKEVIARDPDHAEARAALGYSRVDGAWLSPDAQKRAQGFIKHGGRWIRPDVLRAEEAEFRRLSAARRRRTPTPAQTPPPPSPAPREDSNRADGVVSWFLPLAPWWRPPVRPDRVARPPTPRPRPPPPAPRRPRTVTRGTSPTAVRP